MSQTFEDLKLLTGVIAEQVTGVNPALTGFYKRQDENRQSTRTRKQNGDETGRGFTPHGSVPHREGDVHGLNVEIKNKKKRGQFSNRLGISQYFCV